MSARSTSVSGRSWSGDERAPPDIIDLDKFMRGAVRPSRRSSRDDEARRDKLVVDAGGVERKIPALAKLGGPGAATVPGASLGAPGPPAVTLRRQYSSSSRSTLPPHPQAKRFSHDSGLSDGSYKKRKQRTVRRSTLSEVSRKTVSVARTVAGGTSSDSLRAFRAVCERALLDQQVQIARVAELCERLSERPKPAPSLGSRPAPGRKSDSSSPHSTDETSTTQSTRSRDSRRKDKHRVQTEECKTYKIIMNKLDELNRLFATRAAPPTRHRLPASSGSVSVSDKLVSTEPALLQVPRPRVVTNTCELDIAPCLPVRKRLNISTQRVVTGDSAIDFVSACDARCGFDLEDPIHLYSQAKRLQALPVLKRRARSVEPAVERRLAERPPRRVGDCTRHDASDATLCALCRGCWRSFRQYVSSQIFCYPSGNI